MHGPVEILIAQLVAGRSDGAGGQGVEAQRVDLVEGEPVAHALPVALEENPGIAFVEADEPPVGPAVVRARQVQRGLVVADGDQRLDAVPLQFVEDTVVEGQALLIGLGLVSAWEDARPGDGEAEDLEAHLGEQGDVLGVAVVEVDAFELEVVRGRGFGGRCGDALGGDVLDTQSLAPFGVGALDLVGGGGASPQKSGGEGESGGVCHGWSFHGERRSAGGAVIG